MATLETQQIDDVIVSTRRKMLTLGGAALAGMVFSTSSQAQAATLTDADYLNFALNLEYLEAQFYTLATAGMTIDQMGIGITGTVGTPGGVTTKGSNNYASCKVTFSDPLISAYAVETAKEERNHVKFLRTALGTAAVAQPALDLYNSFIGLGGLLATPVPNFDPFMDDAHFLLGAYIFEDVGVTAYTGAAPALTVSANLDAAAGIQGVEAYHAGLIRTSLFALDAGASGNPGALSTIASNISKLRATVDGSMSINGAHPQGDDIGLGTQQVVLNGTAPVTAATIANASITGSLNPPTTNGSAGALVFSRSAAQVLKIVYAGGTGSGGFFPAGLNGNVK